jgi:hypothetical protein
MQEGAASESSPRDAHVVQGLGFGPLDKRFLANLEEDSATALVLGAHGIHAPLVDVAGASPTRNGFYDLDLFAGTGVLDKVPDVDDAFVAGVGAQALETAELRLYSVVLLLDRWVRMGCARLCGGHEVPPRGPGSGVCDHLRGHLLCLTPIF